MPVLTSLNQLAPKSILRHRPIGTHGTLTEPPRVPRASRAQTHLPEANTTKTTGILPVGRMKATSSPWRQRLVLVSIGVGMIFAVVLVGVGQLLIGWIGMGLDDLHYGRPRTFQVDAFVGHEAGTVASHFVTLNLNGQIEVIEFPGGDATHARIYLGPHVYGANASLIPVTLQFVDSRHDHHPDMIVLFQGEQLIFHNGGGAFHAPLANTGARAFNLLCLSSSLKCS